jgi:hypothetical protein
MPRVMADRLTTFMMGLPLRMWRVIDATHASNLNAGESLRVRDVAASKPRSITMN